MESWIGKKHVVIYRVYIAPADIVAVSKHATHHGSLICFPYW